MPCFSSGMRSSLLEGFCPTQDSVIEDRVQLCSGHMSWSVVCREIDHQLSLESSAIMEESKQTWMYLSFFVCVFLCVFVYVYLSVSICVFVCVCGVYLCVYVHVCVCMLVKVRGQFSGLFLRYLPLLVQSPSLSWNFPR